MYIKRQPVSHKRTNETIVEDEERVCILPQEERIKVIKESVVTEEVIIKKRRKEEDKEIAQTLKKEELNIPDCGQHLKSNTRKTK